MHHLAQPLLLLIQKKVERCFKLAEFTAVLEEASGLREDPVLAELGCLGPVGHGLLVSALKTQAYSVLQT